MASAPTTPLNLSAANSAATSRSNTPSLSMPDPANSAAQSGSETASKIKTLLGILRRFVGVSDLSKIRLSLPSNILSPQGNLDYWSYLQRPDTFTAIGGAESDVGRMMEVLRFWSTKDLHFIKGGPVKPYNSTLGEIFRCNWDIGHDAPPMNTISQAPSQPSPDPLQPGPGDALRISYITEQTSHHPPVSAYWAECPAKGIVLRGYDQISAKFSGTYVRIMAGEHNKGIYITLKNRDNEEYHMTHPDSQLNGLIKAAPYISVADVCYIRCEKTGLKTILHYVEEGYFGRAQNKVIGVVYRYDPENDRYTKPRDVPEKEVLIKIEGDWKDKVYYTIPSTEAVKKEPALESTKDKQLLIDVAPLMPVPKIVPPHEEQLDNETRKQWVDVTNAILEKRFNDANNFKQDIEQRQRDKAAAREKENKTFKPRFFTEVTSESGRPELTDEGRKALEDMQQLNFHLEPRLDDAE